MTQIVYMSSPQHIRLALTFEIRHGRFVVRSSFGRILFKKGIPDDMTAEERSALEHIRNVYEEKQTPVGYDLARLKAFDFKTLWLRMLVKDVNAVLMRLIEDAQAHVIKTEGV